MSCNGRLKLVTAPATRLFDAAEAKLYLRVDDNGEDTLIESLIDMSTQAVEEYLNRKLITQTWAYFLDNFPMSSKNAPWWDGTRDGIVSDLFSAANAIEIPIGGLQSVTHVKTYGTDDAAYTFDSSLYEIDNKGPKARVALRFGQVWPQTVLRTLNGVEIEMVLGYGAASDVPKPIVLAVKEMMAAFYERRGDQELKMPMTAMALCRSYRVENL